MEPERAEIERLHKEVAKLKMERDILKGPRPTSPRSRWEVRLRGEAPRSAASQPDARGSRCLAKRLPRVADQATQSAQPGRRHARGQGAPALRGQRPHIRCATRVARRAGAGSSLRPANGSRRAQRRGRQRARLPVPSRGARTRRGRPTSPASGPTRAGGSWPWCWTCPRVGS